MDKGGVVKNKDVHVDVINNVNEYAKKLDYNIIDLTFSSIKGPSGNNEYLIHLATDGAEKEISAQEVVDSAFSTLNT